MDAEKSDDKSRESHDSDSIENSFEKGKEKEKKKEKKEKKDKDKDRDKDKSKKDEKSKERRSSRERRESDEKSTGSGSPLEHFIEKNMKNEQARSRSNSDASLKPDLASLLRPRSSSNAASLPRLRPNSAVESRVFVSVTEEDESDEVTTMTPAGAAAAALIAAAQNQQVKTKEEPSSPKSPEFANNSRMTGIQGGSVIDLGISFSHSPFDLGLKEIQKNGKKEKILDRDDPSYVSNEKSRRELYIHGDDKSFSLKKGFSSSKSMPRSSSLNTSKKEYDPSVVKDLKKSERLKMSADQLPNMVEMPRSPRISNASEDSVKLAAESLKKKKSSKKKETHEFEIKESSGTLGRVKASKLKKSMETQKGFGSVEIVPLNESLTKKPRFLDHTDWMRTKLILDKKVTKFLTKENSSEPTSPVEENKKNNIYHTSEILNSISEVLSSKEQGARNSKIRRNKTINQVKSQPSESKKKKSGELDYQQWTPHDKVTRIILLGEKEVGKTSMMQTFVSGSFPVHYHESKGISCMSKSIKLEEHEEIVETWAVGGNIERLDCKHLLPFIIGEASILVFLFDLSRKETLDRILSWFEYANSLNDTAKAFVVGTKHDLFGSRPFEDKVNLTAQARKIASSINAPLLFCSPSSVEEAFNIMLGIETSIETESKGK